LLSCYGYRITRCFPYKGKKKIFYVITIEREVVKRKSGCGGINYQLARTVAVARSLIRLGIKRNIGKACVHFLGLLSESVLGDRLEGDIDVDSLLG
jgi:hypothetical protein